MHAETPAYTGEHMCPGGQPAWQTVDGGELDAIHHLADTSLKINPVQATILATEEFRPDLIMGLQTPEVPIDIIGGTKIGAHDSRLCSRFQKLPELLAIVFERQPAYVSDGTQGKGKLATVSFLDLDIASSFQL